jgi:hypothetical protein
MAAGETTGQQEGQQLMQAPGFEFAREGTSSLQDTAVEASRQDQRLVAVAAAAVTHQQALSVQSMAELMMSAEIKADPDAACNQQQQQHQQQKDPKQQVKQQQLLTVRPNRDPQFESSKQNAVAAAAMPGLKINSRKPAPVVLPKLTSGPAVRRPQQKPLPPSQQQLAGSRPAGSRPAVPASQRGSFRLGAVLHSIDRAALNEPGSFPDDVGGDQKQLLLHVDVGKLGADGSAAAVHPVEPGVDAQPPQQSQLEQHQAKQSSCAQQSELLQADLQKKYWQQQQEQEQQPRPLQVVQSVQQHKSVGGVPTRGAYTAEAMPLQDQQLRRQAVMQRQPVGLPTRQESPSVQQLAPAKSAAQQPEMQLSGKSAEQLDEQQQRQRLTHQTVAPAAPNQQQQQPAVVLTEARSKQQSQFRGGHPTTADHRQLQQQSSAIQQQCAEQQQHPGTDVQQGKGSGQASGKGSRYGTAGGGDGRGAGGVAAGTPAAAGAAAAGAAAAPTGVGGVGGGGGGSAAGGGGDGPHQPSQPVTPPGAASATGIILPLDDVVSCDPGLPFRSGLKVPVAVWLQLMPASPALDGPSQVYLQLVAVRQDIGCAAGHVGSSVVVLEGPVQCFAVGRRLPGAATVK